MTYGRAHHWQLALSWQDAEDETKAVHGEEP
jgi:hypothetical protein